MKKKLFFVVVFLIPVFLVGCQKKSSVIKDDQTGEGLTAKQINQKLLDQLPYQQSLAEIMAPFWDSQNPAGLKDKLLELKVPREDLDLHLDLVVALELIEQGQKDFDQAKIEEGLERINKLGEVYEWLKQH